MDAIEDALQAGFRAGLSLDEVFDSTFYLLNVACRGSMQREMAHGWWSERFAREERLSSLLHYTTPSKPGQADDGDALIASFGMMHGLDVSDVDAEPSNTEVIHG